jgi:hypothetical protein
MITIQNQLDHAQLIIHCRFNQLLVRFKTARVNYDRDDVASSLYY